MHIAEVAAVHMSLLECFHLGIEGRFFCQFLIGHVSYAIGVAEPVSLYINTYGTALVNMSDVEIAQKVRELFDLRPAAIIRDLKLTQPMYQETAKYGHVGRTNEVVTKTFFDADGRRFTREVELFTWEKLDRINRVKAAFKI